MKWSDIESRARNLDPKARDAELAQLADAPQFVALAALVLSQEEDAAAIVANPKAARDAGTLAHAAGALYQARVMKDALRALEVAPDGA